MKWTKDELTTDAELTKDGGQINEGRRTRTVDSGQMCGV